MKLPIDLISFYFIFLLFEETVKKFIYVSKVKANIDISFLLRNQDFWKGTIKGI